ncbi:MAG: septum formation initiator family protein [Pseudomonadota bacterium]
MLTTTRNRSRRIVYAYRCALVLFGGYLISHAFHGDHGLIAYASIQEELSGLSSQKEELETRRAQLEVRVNALSDQTLDGDLVDERVRRILAFIGEYERIVVQ